MTTFYNQSWDISQKKTQFSTVKPQQVSSSILIFHFEWKWIGIPIDKDNSRIMFNLLHNPDITCLLPQKSFQCINKHFLVATVTGHFTIASYVGIWIHTILSDTHMSFMGIEILTEITIKTFPISDVSLMKCDQCFT